MVVGPSRGVVDYVSHLACDCALPGVYRYTFRDLVYALSERAMYSRELVPLHLVAGETLAASLARDAKLEYLRQSAAFPGFARALGRTLQELQLSRVPPARLRQAGRSGPDLALLLERWNGELAERGFADYAHRVELAIGEAAQAPQAHRPALLAIDLDVRTTAERHLLEVLENRAAATLHLTVDRRQAIATNALTGIRRYTATGDAAPPRDGDASAAFFSVSSEALEFVEIARRVAASGVPFDEIAVLLRNPTRHVPLLEEAFSRAGIPVWLEGGLRRRDNSGRAFLTLLECREERFSAARFSEYLSIARLPHEIGEPKPSVWERLLNEAAVIAGRERWQSRLDAALARFSAEYERTPSERLSFLIDSLESLREFALPMIDRLAALPDWALWRDWIASLDELAGAALADPRTIHTALDELAPVAGLGPVSLTDRAWPWGCCGPSRCVRSLWSGCAN